MRPNTALRFLKAQHSHTSWTPWPSPKLSEAWSEGNEWPNLLFLSKRRNFGNPIHKQKNKKKSFTFQGSKPTFYINLTHHLHHFLLLNVKKKMIFHLQILRFKAKHAPYTIILTNGRDACKNMQKPTLQWKT
jgi:hypothetical protein